MSVQEISDDVVRPDSVGRRRRLLMVAISLSLMLLIGFAAPAFAGGATQISGIGFIPSQGECTLPLGDFATKLTGDLEGCVYVTVVTSECSPSGTYREEGTEFYVIDGGTQGAGTFSTTYRFTAKFEDCQDGGPLGNEIFGRCQHPIVAGSGTGDFEGATGRLDFKDEVDDPANPQFPYRGHIRW